MDQAGAQEPILEVQVWLVDADTWFV